MPIKRVLLFDLDGTLTDPRVGLVSCTRYALNGLECPSPEDDVLASFIGPPLRSMFTALLPTPEPALVEEAVRLFRERYVHTGIYETRMYDGIAAMLERVRPAAAALYVVTSKPTLFAERIVRHFGIGDHFDGVYGTGLDGSFDNKAELIAHAVATERLIPTEALMVGDRAADVRAAHANGIPTIGVLWGYGSEHELVGAGAQALCGDPGELERVVTELRTFHSDLHSSSATGGT